MRKGARAAVIGSVFAVMVGGAGYGAYNVVTSISGGGATGDGGPAAVKTGPPSSAEVKEASRAFFAAWEKGDAAEAAADTNYASSAEGLLAGYRDDAHLTDVKITPGAASGARVPFSVKATVSYGGKSKPFAYDSELTVVRGETTGKALVGWKPSVVHPELKDGDTLVTGESASPAIEAVDRNNVVLTKEKYPSLGPILDALREKYGDTAGGTPVSSCRSGTAVRAAATRPWSLSPRDGWARSVRPSARARRPPRRRPSPSSPNPPWWR